MCVSLSLFVLSSQQACPRVSMWAACALHLMSFLAGAAVFVIDGMASLVRPATHKGGRAEYQGPDDQYCPSPLQLDGSDRQVREPCERIPLKFRLHIPASLR